MSYLRAEDIALMEQEYGKPVELETEIEMTSVEMERVRRSQYNGRAHDITMFIFNRDKLLFNAKHFYPKGLFRAPSGAAKPGESMKDGAKREAYEETGIKIELEKYIARISVRFVNNRDNNDIISWTSHVFKARYISGEIDPKDKREIREARYVDFNEIPKFNEIMRKTNIGGFRYRKYLTEQCMKLLKDDIVAAIETESQGAG
jgi:ADP-ribose pyrophosphatase YjhB (NUDIX family)